jgi:voltage-gated potassium channel
LDISTVQTTLYRVMEESPDGNRAARYFNYFMTFIILVNVLAVIFETVEPLFEQFFLLFSVIEIISIAIFTIEYILRLWICTLNPAFADPVTGRLRYIISPYGLIDLFSFLPFYIPVFIPIDLRFLRILRLFRIVRVLKLGRYSEALRIFNRVISKTKEELLIALSVLFMILIIFSSLMFYAEHDIQPDKFGSIPQTMWWAIVTLATVGYGDVYPVTVAGKIVGGLAVISGIAIFALPTAILSAGFIDELQERKPIVCPECGCRISNHNHRDSADPFNHRKKGL